MRVVYERCAGLDVHKKAVVACVLATGADGAAREQIRAFGAMTADLVALSIWLREERVECVALESAGVFWWPVLNVLEADGHAVILVNPQHSKALPGRKTDVADSEWLANLLRHGLVRASFIPPAAIRELRDLLRYRKALARERAQEINRLQNVLEGANSKLAAVATDILGVSGRQMLEALADGQEDPEALAELAKRRLRSKRAALRLALDGRVKPRRRLLIRAILRHVGFWEGVIEELDGEVERRLAPFAAEVALLQTIPGVNRTAAATIIAEIGADPARFPSAKRLASWAGICPGNKQSGGKRLSGKTTHGNVWLRGLLGEVTWAAIRKRDTSFGARFRRLARRQDKRKAVVAVRRHLLIVVYSVLRDHVPYHELGADYFQPTDSKRQASRLVDGLQRLGYEVAITKEAS